MKKLRKFLFHFISAGLIIVIGAAIAIAMHLSARKLPLRQYFPQDSTTAVWDWDNPTSRTTDELNELTTYLHMHQINTVYLDISAVVDAPQPEVKQLSDAINKYVTIMSGKNIRVLAAAGNTDWSKPAQRHIPLSIQQFVYTYNEAHRDHRLAGLEFDIEAYNQTGFPDASNTEKGLVLTELLDTVNEIADKHTEHGNTTDDTTMELGFALPYWFDNENGNIPSVTWKGKTGPMIYHIVDRLNALPKANIVVMAYRNAALGNDGTIFHSRTEVDYAQAKAPNVKVIIGQEVNEVEPAKITFAGKSTTELSNEVSHIADEFEKTDAYGGVAINDLAGLKRLDQNE